MKSEATKIVTSYSCDVTDLGERISAIILPQQRKQWLSVELNRWRSEIINCLFLNNKNRTLIFIMEICMSIITKLFLV